MVNSTYRAKVTRFDGGKTLIEPYKKTGSKRYEYLLSTEHTQLRTTMKDYVIIFRFPRVNGILAATRNLISETARLAILMSNEFFNHNLK